ncbi:hypothetical protein BCR36DRAFT_310078 [Piromyces finnis]|uniref:CBM10 domain-containing protein n=1 Tax=Piromyces finnis TaxID=1754191 RepID=A0A1Y1UVW8_9FUNG|nr:hypothetical protein BCR36DRAFT_310078 [Piromyces finnis]|eukprot:ORX41759.1 hypothetical protein BCR36DRAFT_310078 [Piromyces finnis]
MKFSNILSLLFVGYEAVHAYSDCKNCRVVTVEDGVSWGVENNDWCVSKFKSSICNKNDSKNQCFSYPDYPCCSGCDAIYEDDDGKWGVENNDWCGIKDSCFKSSNDAGIADDYYDESKY